MESSQTDAFNNGVSNLPSSGLFAPHANENMMELNNEVASELGGCSNDETSNCIEPASQTPIENNIPRVKSFSQVLKRIVHPKKDQAIIFSSIEGTPIKNYIVNLGKVVGPKNVLFASRISNNRVCVYLSSKATVDKFMITHGGISLDDLFVPCRRLISPAKRIILSGVSPCIPHDLIENVLQSNGFKMVSPVTYLGAGIGLPEYSHVYSFRRQVFILPDDNFTQPSSLIVDFEGDSYRIFVSSDELRCFKCKQIGHISKNCPENLSQANEAQAAEEPVAGDPIPTDTVSSHLENEATGTKGVKRLLSMPSGSEIQPEGHEEPFAKPQSRDTSRPSKRHKSKKADKPELYEPLRALFDGGNQVMNFDDFKSFVSSVKGKDNPITIAQEYTTEIPLLISLLHKAHPLIEVRSLRERMKRLAVNLLKGSTNEGDSSDYSTDTSSQQ